VSCYADGVSLDYFLRFRSDRESATYIWSMVAALMLINYALNFVVIGLPAIRFGAARPRKVGIGLIFDDSRPSRRSRRRNRRINGSGAT
jgi:hypothetical protein